MSTVATPKPKNPCLVVTGEVRLSYVTLLEPRKFNETDADAKYSVTILIDKSTDNGKATIERIKAGFKAAVIKGSAKHFDGRVPENVNNTLKDGDVECDDLGDLKSSKNPEYAGHMYMRLSTKYKPSILDNNMVAIIDPALVYSGVYGAVSLTTFPYSGDGRRGVSAVLNNVKILRDGESLTTHVTGDELA